MRREKAWKFEDEPGIGGGLGLHRQRVPLTRPKNFPQDDSAGPKQAEFSLALFHRVSTLSVGLVGHGIKRVPLAVIVGFSASKSKSWFGVSLKRCYRTVAYGRRYSVFNLERLLESCRRKWWILLNFDIIPSVDILYCAQKRSQLTLRSARSASRDSIPAGQTPCT